jgi:glycerate-2-kinase
LNLESRTDRRDLIVAAFEHAVAENTPGNAVRATLARTGAGFTVDETDVPVAGQLHIVAIGKAASAMADAAFAVVGDRMDHGIVLTKDGHAGALPPAFQVFEAAHPVPDQRGISASQMIVDSVEHLGPEDVVLALISGGGSALFEAPVDGVTLADLQLVTDVLLRAGAPIQHLNAVRSELSQVKGGGLRRHIDTARTVSLILSDVLGNSPEIIASGPTVRREKDPGSALDVLDRYGATAKVPDAVLSHLEAQQVVAAVDDVSERDNDVFRIIGDNTRLVEAFADALVAAGLSVDIAWRDQEGEARERALEWVKLVEESQADAVVGGGEMTVMVQGTGVGGRNTEFALAAAVALHEGNRAVSIASLASDGQDGGVDAAGAVVDAETVSELNGANIDVQLALANNDSGSALEAIGALVAPGPTGTNVNDVYIGLQHHD